MTSDSAIGLRIVYSILWVSLCLMKFSEINAQCIGNGLKDCACNFIKACEWDSSTKKFSSFRGSDRDLEEFFPSGLKELANDKSQIAEICEPSSIGIFYDCKNRIPLACTYVMTADQYTYPHYDRGSHPFIQSDFIETNLQQQDYDYYKSSMRMPCYETAGKKSYIEPNWYETIKKRVSPLFRKCSRRHPTSPIHRGHLIAAQYGRGRVSRVKETFVYTNAVPQFATLNSGSWKNAERELIVWATNNCNGAPLHVIVGSVPSTFGQNEKRFFGEPGFSDYEGPSKIYLDKKRPYRVNMPAYMWTAACCQTNSFTKSTAFYAKNHPGKGLVKQRAPNNLFLNIQDYPFGRARSIQLFPQEPECLNNSNYVRLM